MLFFVFVCFYTLDFVVVYGVPYKVCHAITSFLWLVRVMCYLYVGYGRRNMGTPGGYEYSFQRVWCFLPVFRNVLYRVWFYLELSQERVCFRGS
ncbi:hypothetical protein EI42_03335 [Thermosporothrix hazakensis]|uniref:Uncharacterized protein n=1 Tax=Thermosporothrix hazakensis TaxID=644383 RepID=A0A326U6K6_THEHA|nr:hypothetical protein EI42_03335 [Thermosporothrix hazakensis]